MDKYLLLKIFLIFVILSGSGWLGYDLYTEKPVIVEETSEEEVQENTEENLVERWQTYRNEEYEFEIRYPSEFNTEKQEPVIYSGYDVESLSNDFKFVIKHPDNPQNLILRIAVSSREFLESQSGSITEPPVPSLEKWDLEKEFLAGNSKGVECSFLLTGQNICRIVEKNGITMLDRIKLWPPGGDAGRYLTFYSDKFRYDIIIFSSEIWDILPYGSEFSFDGIDNPSQDSFIQLSNQILSTFKFIEPVDTSSWQTYRNEQFGLEFEYSTAWGELSMEAAENGSFTFTASNENLIKTVIFHKPSKQLSFVEKQGEYPSKFDENKKLSQEIIKVVSIGGEIKTVFEVPEESVPYYGSVNNLTFSPEGSYLGFNLSFYETGQSMLFNINEGFDVFESYDIQSAADIFWSDDENILFTASYGSQLSGDGSDAILISDYGDPKTLKVVLDVDEGIQLFEYKLDDVQFKDDKILFSLTQLRFGSSEDPRATKSEVCDCYNIKIEYEYFIETKTLKSSE